MNTDLIDSGYMVLPILLASFPLISKISDLLQAHVCISATSRIGAELGYDVSVVSDAIGDRDIPGAKAGQLVDVSDRSPSMTCSME